MTDTIATVVLPDGETIPKLGLGTWEMGERPARRADEIAALRLGLDSKTFAPATRAITAPALATNPRLHSALSRLVRRWLPATNSECSSLPGSFSEPVFLKIRPCALAISTGVCVC